MQKRSPQKSKIQAASLYSEKSLFAQCVLLTDRLNVDLLLLFIIDIELFFSKSCLEFLIEDSLESFKRYLRARFWIENPFALERFGQKIFKINLSLYLRKLKKI